MSLLHRRILATLPVADRMLRVSKQSLTVREGATGTFDVWLTGPPRSGETVTVAVTSTETGEATVNKNSLSFTGANFSTKQTVTVSGVTDSDSRDENTSITLVATGGGFDDSTAIAVVVEDNDTARLRVSDSSLTFSSTTLRRTISVRLSTQPSGNVTVAISDNSGRFSTNKSTLTFTNSNWNVDQIVQVNATTGGSASGTLTLNPAGNEYETVASVNISLSFTLTLPGLPTGIRLTPSYTNANTQQQIRATWTAGSRSTSTEMRYKRITDVNWTTLTGLSGTAHTITGAPADTTFEFQFQGRNASGPSGWTDSERVTTGEQRGNLYLLGDATGKIYRMSGGYSTSGTWDSEINTPSGENFRYGLAIDSSGNFYMSGSFTEKIFRRSGGSWDSGIAIPSTEGTPRGIAFDAAGNLYLAGDQRHKIYRMSGGYSTSGTWDSGIAVPSGETQINGIAFDAAGNLYLAGGTRDKIYRMSGGYSTSGSWDSGVNAPSGETQPYGVAFDFSGNLIISGRQADKVYIMAGGYSTSGTWDSGIDVPSGESAPTGIAIY